MTLHSLLNVVYTFPLVWQEGSAIPPGLIYLKDTALQLRKFLKRATHPQRNLNVFAKSDTEIEAMIQRYVMFLHLHRDARQRLVPTPDIELVWITHMLKPSQYRKYTWEHLGSSPNIGVCDIDFLVFFVFVF